VSRFKINLWKTSDNKTNTVQHSDVLKMLSGCNKMTIVQNNTKPSRTIRIPAEKEEGVSFVEKEVKEFDSMAKHSMFLMQNGH
jgi:hypothetical protein